MTARFECFWYVAADIDKTHPLRQVIDFILLVHVGSLSRARPSNSQNTAFQGDLTHHSSVQLAQVELRRFCYDVCNVGYAVQNGFCDFRTEIYRFCHDRTGNAEQFNCNQQKMSRSINCIQQKNVE